MNFGQALENLKEGKLVQRVGWNGKGMFIFQRPTAEVPIIMVKSLPDSVKEYYLKKDPNYIAKFTAYLCMKAADNSIVNGWLASQTDILAEDWQVVE